MAVDNERVRDERRCTGTRRTSARQAAGGQGGVTLTLRGGAGRGSLAAMGRPPDLTTYRCLITYPLFDHSCSD